MSDFYVKKPIPVEAYKWNGTVPFKPSLGFNPIFVRDKPAFFKDEPGYKLETAEGLMSIKVGSYIVKGPAGEYWAVREDIFENTYEKIKNA
jgi:hypothetical protein